MVTKEYDARIDTLTLLICRLKGLGFTLGPWLWTKQQGRFSCLKQRTLFTF